MRHSHVRHPHCFQKEKEAIREKKRSLPTSAIPRRCEEYGLALVFSDQIPLWIKMGFEKEVFAKWESAPG